MAALPQDALILVRFPPTLPGFPVGQLAVQEDLQLQSRSVTRNRLG